MTPQERDVIAGIFDRLKQVSNQPRDPEAEKLIAERLAQQPYAPYAMAQAVYVQEQALLTMQAQVEQLQAQVQQLQSQPQPAAGGFLSSLFGGGAPAQPAPLQQPAQSPFQRGPAPQAGAVAPGMMPRQGQPEQAAGPWGAAQQRQGGGFMATALTTAAGVAGGMVLGSVLMNALGGSKPATDPSAAPAAAPADSAAASGPDAAMEPASYDDSGMFDEGGGGDDWA
ncbi:MAG: DUF2076 domain-containing protein [Bosea sp. (in: a-proteobacteria)]|jgi:hypothetical protein